MNEKQFARYLRAVRRRLTLPKKMKDRVMDNLRSSINERREAGQTDAEILAALGSAKQAASELTAQLPATRSARVHCDSSASAQRCLLCWLGF